MFAPVFILPQLLYGALLKRPSSILVSMVFGRMAHKTFTDIGMSLIREYRIRVDLETSRPGSRRVATDALQVQI